MPKEDEVAKIPGASDVWESLEFQAGVHGTGI